MATDPNAVLAAPALQGRSVGADRGWQWIVEGWGYFKRQPGMWIGLIVIFAVILIVLALIPILGSLVTTLLSPVFGAGIMIGCKAQDEGRPLEIAHLFAGFQQQLGVLIMVGVIYLVGMVAIMLVGVMIGGASLLPMFGLGSDSPAATGAAVMGMLLALLVMLALMIPLLMAVWFASPLVVFRKLGAVEAVKSSFFGCLKNIVPFLIWGVIGMVLGAVASIPLGLGWLVLGPVLAGSIYASYKDIYGAG